MKAFHKVFLMAAVAVMLSVCGIAEALGQCTAGHVYRNSGNCTLKFQVTDVCGGSMTYVIAPMSQIVVNNLCPIASVTYGTSTFPCPPFAPWIFTCTPGTSPCAMPFPYTSVTVTACTINWM